MTTRTWIRPIAGVCAYCYAALQPGRRRTARYCGSTCRVKAHRLRIRASRAVPAVSPGELRP